MDTAESHLLIQSLTSEVLVLKSLIVELQRENSALKARLILDSTTSSKPPSSDGLKKRTASLRSSSGLSVGGQLGHKGFTLKRVETPDTVEEHRPLVCGACEAPLNSSPLHVERRQIFDIPLPKMMVHEHRALHIRCVCGQMNKGKFPPTVISPTAYGENLRSQAAYYHTEQLLPMKRVADALRDGHGVALSVGTIATMIGKKGDEFAPQAAAIKAKLLEAPVTHLDETGMRAKGKTQWLHSISDSFWTYLRLDARRGAITQVTQGIVVHDHWKPYFKLAGVEHALCNAHILRELNALIEIEKEDWAKEMRDLLLTTLNRVVEAKKNEKSCLTFDEIDGIEQDYKAIIARGLAFHIDKMVIPPALKRGTIKRAKGHNLLNRLNNHQADILRFVHNFAVPFTNNQAERDIRMMKVKQKISGSFRTEKGANRFLTLKSVLASAKKQGLNALNIINQTQKLNLCPVPS